MVDLQGAALTWISVNQPDYTITDAALLEARLQDDVINKQYIQPPRKWITNGTVAISIVNANFVMTGEIHVSEPKATWKIEGQMTADL